MFDVVYASVVINRPGYTVTGCVLTCQDQTDFESKLRLYDKIEGYCAENPSDGLYERAVTTAYLENGQTIQCYIYHRTNIDVHKEKPIPSGNWLDRENKWNFIYILYVYFLKKIQILKF